MQSHIIVGGASGIGQELCEIIYRETKDHILVFDQNPPPSDTSFNSRVTYVSVVVSENLNWGIHIEKISSVKSLSFVIPACKSRDPNSNDIGYTDQFIQNIGMVNYSLLRLIDCARHKFAEQSSVVLVSSVLGTKVTLGDATLDYHCSKAVLESITRYMSLRLAPNTTVNGVAPGLIARGETSALITNLEILDAVRRSVPLQRPCKQIEVANAIFTLLSGSLGCVTGQIIIMDGGSSNIETYSLVQGKRK